MKAGTHDEVLTGWGVAGESTPLVVVAAVSALNSGVAVVVGGLMLAFNSQEVYAPQLLSLVALSSGLVTLFVRSRLGRIELPLLGLVLAALASAVLVSLLPQYWHGLGIQGIIHRSFVSGLLLLAVAVPCAVHSTYYCLRATPQAYDLSRYPLLTFVAAAALIGFALVVYYILKNGVLQLDWSVISTPFVSQSKIVETWKEGWPTYTTLEVKHPGMLNHVTGTLLLMGLTTLISLPIGVGTGVFVHEYAGRKLGGLITFSTMALRSISGIILAVTALSVLTIPESGSFLQRVLRGYGYDVNGVLQLGRSSFIFASAFISLLVIPVVAKATQEGLGSLPREIREGSLGLGASQEYTLFHVQLPWSWPNIVTGIVLGCAEAAGALTIVFLMAGSGENGIGPLNETTSLSFLVFDIRYGRILGDAAVENMMAGYQYAAALVLLIITLCLTVAALLMKRRLEKRYKGV